MNTTSTNMTHALPWSALSALSALLCGCGLLDVQDDAFNDDGYDTYDTDSSDTSEPPAPTEGFSVAPKFQLQPVPAVVTIEAGDGTGTPTACVLDGAPEGGYVCDAGQLVGVYATIRVDRDGFEGAVRSAEIPFNQIQPLDVHLAVEGGPTGSWSACVSVGEFDSCAALCEAQMLGCVATSCATEQAQWPIATLETFSSLECADPLESLIESLASSCGDPLPLTPDVASLHCCCSG